MKWEEKSVRLEHLMIQRHQEERYVFCRERKILAKQMEETNAFRYERKCTET